MPTTPNVALPYPEPADPPLGPAQIQDLAEEVDVRMQVIREAALNVEYPEYGADPAAPDNSAAIQAAIDDLPQGSITSGRGGEILLPRLYKCASPLLLHDDFSVVFKGFGAPCDPLEPQRSGLVYTGGGSTTFLQPRSMQGFKTDGIAIGYDNAGFTGILVDLSHSGAAGDTSYAALRDTTLGGIGDVDINGAAALVKLEHAIACTFDNVLFAQAQNLIRGREESAGSVFYSNAHSFRDCMFMRYSDAIVNPGDKWLFDACKWEALAQGITPQHAIYNDLVTPGAIMSSLSIRDAWMGDAFSGIPDYWMDFGDVAVWGLMVDSGQIFSKKVAIFRQAGRNIHFINQQPCGEGDHLIDLGDHTIIGEHEGVWITGNDFSGCTGVDGVKNRAGHQKRVILSNVGAAGAPTGAPFDTLDLYGPVEQQAWRGLNPTITPLAGAGAGATAFVTPRQGGGTLTLNTGTGATAADQFTVDLGIPLDQDANVVFTPASWRSGANAPGFYRSGRTETGFTIGCANAPADSVQYEWDFVLQAAA